MEAMRKVYEKRGLSGLEAEETAGEAETKALSRLLRVWRGIEEAARNQSIIHFFFTQAHQPNGDRHLISSSPLLQVSTCRTVCCGGFLFSREFVPCFSPHAHERTRKCRAGRGFMV